MIEIENVSLRLPPGYGPRAAGIARELGAALAGLSALSPLRLERLVLGPLRLRAGMSDREIGAALGREVMRGVKAER